MFTEVRPTSIRAAGTCPGRVAAAVPLARHRQFHPDGIPIRIRILDSDGGLAGDDDVVESFVLQVPFGGRWTGPVDWPDHCIRGGSAEVCWQIDVGQDSDGDGLLDDWEQNGLDVDGDGTIDVDLPAMGADPLHKDIFLEYDMTTGSDAARRDSAHEGCLCRCPDRCRRHREPGRPTGINLHVDTGALIDRPSPGGGSRGGTRAPDGSSDNDRSLPA